MRNSDLRKFVLFPPVVYSNVLDSRDDIAGMRFHSEVYIIIL
jgi:hypothetical protein